jgi:putative membrane protein
MVCWFAGIFYLPRIFVYYAQAEDPATRQTLATMARKLFKFVTPFMILTLFFGLWRLSYQFDYYLTSGWMHLKLLLVVFLVAYHVQCGVYMARINRGEDDKTHVFYRIFNEVPVLALFVIVMMVYLRPF